MPEFSEKLIELGFWFHVCYTPNLEGRNEGDEFDYPPEDHHWRCEIVIDTEESAEGHGDTEEEALAAALKDFQNKIN